MFEHAEHISSCFEKYRRKYVVKRNRAPSPSPTPVPRPSSTVTDNMADADDKSSSVPDPLYLCTEPLYAANDLFGETRFAQNVCPEIYETQFTNHPRGDNWTYNWWHEQIPIVRSQNQITFQRESDDQGAFYIRMYECMKRVYPKFDMWHIMVRFSGYRSFLEAMHRYGDGAFILPHWCLCRGGKVRDPIYNHHKHMILVARDMSHFKKECWDKIRSDLDLPDEMEHYKCKMEKDIQHQEHLMYAIRYVGKRESKCVFDEWENEMDIDDTGNEEAQQQPPLSRADRHLNHYYLNYPVSKHFRFVGSSLIQGGWSKLVTKRCGSRRVGYFAAQAECSQQSYGRFYVKIKHAFEMDPEWLNVVLPVEKHWVPYKIDSGEEMGGDRAYILLMNDQKLHFKREDEEEETVGMLTDDEWKTMQAENGNLVLGTMRDNYWYPTKNQQATLNEIVPLLREKEFTNELFHEKCQEKQDLQKKNAKQAKKMDRMQKMIEERDVKILKLKERIVYLTNRVDTVQEKKDELAANMIQDLRANYQRVVEERDELKRELRELKANYQSVVEERDALKRDIQLAMEELSKY